MRIHLSLTVVALCALATPCMAGEAASAIARVYTDSKGADVHVVYRDGSEVLAPREDAQRGVTDPILADDGQTIGWAVLTDGSTGHVPGPHGLVVFASGSGMRRFDAETSIWSWRFYEGGREVGLWDRGPDGGTYKLYNVATGHMIQAVPASGGVTPPDWAKGLSFDYVDAVAPSDD